jgi:hypothetical protein
MSASFFLTLFVVICAAGWAWRKQQTGERSDKDWSA